MATKREPAKNAGHADGEISQAAGDLETEELTRTFGYLLRRLQLAYRKNFQRIASDEVQNGQVGALLLIGHNPGITPSQIGVQLAMEPAQVAVVVGKLELQRLVRRPSSRSDGRSRPVRLSALGEKYFAMVRATTKEAERSFIGDALTEEEVHQLRELLGKLVSRHDP